LESVADPLRVEKDRIVNVGDGLVVSLASVEEAGHVVGAAWRVLGAQDLGHEFYNLRSELFFVDHVVASDQIGVLLLANTDVLQDLRTVRLAHHLVGGQDQRHFKVWNSSLDVVDDSLNHGEFVDKRNDLLLLVLEAARRVPQLNDEDILSDAGVDVGTEKSREVRLVLG